MASTDHTARSRPLVRDEPNPKPTPNKGSALDAAGDGPAQLRTCDIHAASTARAIVVMGKRLSRHHALRHSHIGCKGKGLSSPHAAQRIDLVTAPDLRHHPIDTLTPERVG